MGGGGGDGRFLLLAMVFLSGEYVHDPHTRTDRWGWWYSHFEESMYVEDEYWEEGEDEKYLRTKSVHSDLSLSPGRRQWGAASNI